MTEPTPPNTTNEPPAMKVGEPGGHFDHMMRQSRAHHVTLSQLADTKANMLLTVAAIVIPLSIQYLSDPVLRWPAAVMIFFCILTVMAAAYAAMPKIRPDRAPNRSSKAFNPMFFGDFVHLDYDTFLVEMEKVMRDPAAAYEACCRDMYLMGQYLAKRKYKYLRLGYIAFLTGLAASAVTWVLALLLASRG